MSAKSMFRVFYRQFRWLAITTDATMLSASYFGAAFAVLGRLGFPEAINDILLGYPLLAGLAIVALAVRGVYRSFIRYTSIQTYLKIAQALLIATALAAWPFFIFDLSTMIPWRVLPVFAAFAIGTTSIIRALLAVWQTRPRSRGGTRVLIYGAGEGGALAARDLLQSNVTNYTIAGFVDDDRSKSGRELLGIPVLGSGDALGEIIEDHRIEEIVIAIPSASGSALRQILRKCRRVQIRVHGKPTPELTNAQPFLGPLARLGGDLSPQEIAMASLLRRAPRDLDPARISGFFGGKRILVTGAGGSIGSEIVLVLSASSPQQIILLDMNEENLHRSMMRVAELTGSEVITSILGDVSNRTLIDQVFRSERPDAVVHAAAYKHVRLVEENPCRAILNNVGGTINIVDAADTYGAATVINISTDKAVHPTTVMGATKRLSELYLTAMNQRSESRLISVRFGNVLGSSGSVVPIISEQIRSGGPVTVTDPEATRFFMLTSEAAQLTLQAATIGSGGETYVLDMGEPIRIIELVNLLIELHGYEPDGDISIQYTGLGKGEKLHEELWAGVRTKVQGFDGLTLDVAEPIIDFDQLSDAIEELFKSSRAGDVENSIKLLNRLAESEPGVGLGGHQSLQ